MSDAVGLVIVTDVLEGDRLGGDRLGAAFMSAPMSHLPSIPRPLAGPAHGQSQPVIVTVLNCPLTGSQFSRRTATACVISVRPLHHPQGP
jgi:hypothetical protein